MTPLLYDTLVRFYPLLDPLEDHADEGEAYGGVLTEAVSGARSLLELGAGAGHGAHYVKRHFESAVLTDLSPAMLARSEALNPDCEHLVGDMRTLRLGRRFDTVLCHDAIAYATTQADLQAVFETAFEHLREGGAALFVPDCLQETFVEGHESHAADGDGRSLRCVSWWYDPDPSDTTHVYDFAFLLREHGEVEAVHDRHICGLFPELVWLETARAVGFDPQIVQRSLPAEFDSMGYTDKMFLLRRPAQGAP